MEFSDLIIEHIARIAGKAQSQVEGALEIEGLMVKFVSGSAPNLFERYLRGSSIEAVRLNSDGIMEVQVPLRSINPSAVGDGTAKFYLEEGYAKIFVEKYGDRYSLAGKGNETN